MKKEIIKYSKKLNSTNLSALRSGNISARGKNKGVDGFYITPSGMKYSSSKTKGYCFRNIRWSIREKQKTIIRMEISSGYLCE
jgi:L-fuculose-phosphate aldolase